MLVDKQDQVRQNLIEPAGKDDQSPKNGDPASFSEAAVAPDSEETQYNSGFLTLLVSVSAIGGFLFGYDTSVIGGAQLYFKDDWPDISDAQVATIVSITMLGAAIGALSCGSISDHYGRKPVIMFADVFFTLGSLIMGFATTIGTLIAGRFVVGLGIGVASYMIPLYISEVAPVQVRGKLVTFNVLLICFAQMLSTCICFAMRPHWRYMLAFVAFVSMAQFIGMIFMPESPRWLGKAGKAEL